MRQTIEDCILVDKDIARALSLLKQRMDDLKIEDGRDKLESIEADYKLMLNCYSQGMRDPNGESMYLSVLRRLYSVYNIVRLASIKKKRGVFFSADKISNSFCGQNDSVIDRLEHFVQDVALATLLSDAERLSETKKVYARHQRYMEQLFNYILVSNPWNDETCEFYKNLLLSPTVDVIDSSLIVSALTLSLLVVFDPNKWLVLYGVYSNGQVTQLCQRALVGLYVTAQKKTCAVFPEIQKAFEEICTEDKVLSEIVELQIQMYYCANAEADNAEIQRDIMPTLIKNGHLGMSNGYVVEKDDDSLSDILGTDDANAGLCEMEDKINKMRDMYKNGSDIYFGGFSQMKRFSFFYQISNWFVPFYLEHPDISNASTADILDVLSNNVVQTPFCDSDKYSFAFALSTVYNRLPASIREVLGSNNETAFFNGMDIDVASSTYLRRMYLQNLYRFFMLYQGRKDFSNPFACRIKEDGILAYLTECRSQPNENFMRLILFFFRKKEYQCVIELCLERYDKGIATLDEMVLLAYSLLNIFDNERAYDVFAYLNAIKMDDVRILNGLARSSFNLRKYEESAEFYGRLINLDGGKRKYVINGSVAQINIGNIKDSLAALYQLDYEYGFDVEVKRAIVWGNLMSGNPTEAERVCNIIKTKGKLSAVDYLNIGYANWMQRKTHEAVSCFKKYIELSPSDESNLLEKEFCSDVEMLRKGDVKDFEIKIMLSLVAGND